MPKWTDEMEQAWRDEFEKRFRERTPPRNVDEANWTYRVNWSEMARWVELKFGTVPNRWDIEWAEGIVEWFKRLRSKMKKEGHSFDPRDAH